MAAEPNVLDMCGLSGVVMPRMHPNHQLLNSEACAGFCRSMPEAGEGKMHFGTSSRTMSLGFEAWAGSRPGSQGSSVLTARLWMFSSFVVQLPCPNAQSQVARLGCLRLGVLFSSQAALGIAGFGQSSWRSPKHLSHGSKSVYTAE